MILDVNITNNMNIEPKYLTKIEKTLYTIFLTPVEMEAFRVYTYLKDKQK